MSIIFFIIQKSRIILLDNYLVKGGGFLHNRGVFYWIIGGVLLDNRGVFYWIIRKFSTAFIIDFKGNFAKKFCSKIY